MTTLAHAMPAVSPAAHAFPELGVKDAWYIETVAICMTMHALDLIEEGERDWAEQLYDRSETANRRAFDDFLAAIESPALNWEQWLDACQVGYHVEFAGSPVSFPEFPTEELSNCYNSSADPRTLSDAWEPYPIYEPTPEDRAWVLGESLGLRGISADPDPLASPDEAVAFRAGNDAGLLDLDRTRESIMADGLEDEGRPEDSVFADIHPDEAVRAVGCVVARSLR